MPLLLLPVFLPSYTPRHGSVSNAKLIAAADGSPYPTSRGRASLVAAMRGFDVALKSNENWRSRTAGLAAEGDGSRGTDLFAHRLRTRSSRSFDDEGGKDAKERGELDLSVPDESSVPSGSGVEQGWGSQGREPGYELLHNKDEDDQNDYVAHGQERGQGRGGYGHVSVVVGKSEGGWAKADLGWGLLRQALRTVHKGARKWLGKGEFVGWGGLWGVGYGAGSWCGSGDLPGKAADVTRSLEVAANWQQFVDELPVYSRRFSAIEDVGGRGARNSLGGGSANGNLRQRAEEAWCRGGDMKKGQREALNLYRHALRDAGGNDVELLCSYAQAIMMKQWAL